MVCIVAQHADLTLHHFARSLKRRTLYGLFLDAFVVMAIPPNPVRFEHHTASPVLGVGAAAPRLSWYVPEADAAYRQTSYEIEITRGQGTTCHRVQSGEQVLVPWPGDPLRSRESAAVRVRVAHREEWSG